MPLRFRARDVATPIVLLLAVAFAACGGADHVVGPNDNGTMVLDDALDADTVVAAPLSRVVSVTLRDRKGLPISATRVDWIARDHGSIAPSFSLTDDSGRAVAVWTFGRDTGQHRAAARAKGFKEVTLTARAAVVVSPLLLRELRPLQLITYDGSGQTVHPDYLSDEAGFGRAFLALTPYKSGDATFENPAVYTSTDMLRWRVPAGSPNPLVLPGAFYLSDPDIVFDPVLRELRLYYRQVGTTNTILMIRSRDAVTWSAPEVVLVAPNHEIVSPSIVRRSAKEWLMWSVNAHKGCSDVTADLEVRRSSDGTEWSQPEPVALSQTGFSPWHVDVQWIPSREEYWAVYPVKTPGTCTTTALYLATSRDGLSWKTHPSPVIARGESNALTDIVYRSTFAYDAKTDEVTFWYSGARYEHPFYVWGTVVQRTPRADVFAKISRPLRANLMGPRRETPPLTNPP